jgi:hypothetical protein
MRRVGFVIGIVASSLVLSACGTANQHLADSSETIELYHIFDIKTAADIDTVVIAAADGLAQNTNQIQQNRPLMMSTDIPVQPGRFKLMDMSSTFAGAGMGGMLQHASSQAGGTTMRIAKCDGAVWTSKATRAMPGYSNLNLYSCLYGYKGGYQLDVYGAFQKNLGGVSGLTQSLASGLVGTPEQWVNKTIMDTVRSIASASHSEIVQIEGRPRIASDQLPWVDMVSAR